MTYADNYVKVAQLDLDLPLLKMFSKEMQTLIINKWVNETDNLYKDSSITTTLHTYYNFLLFPNPQVGKLFLYIQNMFSQIRDKEHTEQYYISMWLNIHKKNEFLNWHSHNKPEENSYHGYFCINAEPSKTMYKLKDGNQVDVINKNNQLVISKSDGDLHCVTPWGESSERITLAFDIIPSTLAYSSLMTQHRTNNWIPI